MVIYELVAGRHPYWKKGDTVQNALHELRDHEPLFLPSSLATPDSPSSTLKVGGNGKRRFADLTGPSQSSVGMSPKYKRIDTSWEAFRAVNTYRTLGVQSTPENLEISKMIDAIIAFRVSPVLGQILS